MNSIKNIASLASRIAEYESGEMDEEGILKLFQDLVDTGLAWQLQGHYGRTAQQLIEAGVIHAGKELA
ncbi:MAG: hypothetical protein QW793_06235 [Candidatus Caldarchaeum sp.]